MTFVNLSNHPIEGWSNEQRTAAIALGHGEPVDLPSRMPLVPPDADTAAVWALAEELVATVVRLGASGAMVSTDFTITYALVTLLEAAGVATYSATTERNVVEKTRPDGTTEKIAVFRFVRWRRFVRG